MDDIARKILQILWNQSRGQEVYVDVRRLQRLSGRSEAQIKAALQRLSAEEYIQYDGQIAKVLRLPVRDLQRQEIRYWEYD